MRLLPRFLAIGAVAFGVGFSAQAAEITGAGASFPAPIYAKWAEAYRAATGNALNYQAIGSGGGVRQITAKTVDFGASDDPIPGDELDKAGLVQFPAVIGGIVPVVNLQGVAPGEMKLDGPTLSKIFSGDISRWDDAAIAALNKGVTLPSQAITLVYRSDSSGTTAGFTYYLAEIDPPFADKVGAGKTVDWASGVGGKGNAGVAANVSKLGGSIGYVEYAYAKQNDMTHVSLINKAGNAVQPSAESFAAAAAGADWSARPGFGIGLSNQDDPQAWPIVSASFILMHRQADDAAASAEALKFFRWSFANGDQMALDLDYVPMPKSVVEQVEASWADIKDSSGKTVMAAN
ncbi:MAG: phosphate ABC transporter substrate-binding protein PstS [Burkholderiaceae bacterium]